MTLSKYTDNLHQSEVYRELERQAVKKGFFKPTENELVKLAAQEVEITENINRQVDVSPSDDLIQDVARLAYAMRRKGFITQAEDLEHKLVIYKQAENSLYNVTQETNADFIGFAHRDGDVNLIDGSGDLGDFETIQSVADKILAVTRKQPTGKQPMDRLAAFASMINKVAQQGGAPGYDTSSQGGAPAQGGQAAFEAAPQSTQDYTPAKEAPKTRREILTAVENTLNSFDAVRKQIPAIQGMDTFGFDNLEDPNEQSAYVYFARLAGSSVNPRDISTWFNAQKVATNEGVFQGGISAQMMFNKLRNQGSNSVDVLKDIAKALGVENDFMSMFGNQNSQLYLFNSAIGIDYAFNMDNIWKACVWLQQAGQGLINRVFGANNEIFNAAQNSMIGIIEKLTKELDAINISEPISTTNAALSQLVKVSKGISDAMARFTNGDSYKNLRLVNSSVIDQLVTLVSSTAKNISEQYKGMSGSDGVKPVDINASILDKTIAYWESQTSSEDEGVANKAAMVSDKIQQVQEIIKQYNGKPWVEFQEALSEMKPPIDAPNKSVFLAGLNRIISSSKGVR